MTTSPTLTIIADEFLDVSAIATATQLAISDGSSSVELDSYLTASTGDGNAITFTISSAGSSFTS